jgi:hypothetical protein
MKKSLIAAVACVFVATAVVVPASAEEAAGASPWRFSVTPVAIWGFNIDGPIIVEGRSRYVNASFSDVKNSIDSAGGLGLSMGKGSWDFALNGNYIKFLDEDSKSNLDPSIRTDNSLKWTTIEASGAYRLPIQRAPKAPQVALSLGVRFNQMEVEVDATQGATFTVDADRSWTDPFVGMSVVQPIVKGLAGIVRGDVGGFGLSSNQTKYTWNFTAGMGYRWGFDGWAMSAMGGWKMNEFDYEDEDPARLQLIQRFQGPVGSLTFSF